MATLAIAKLAAWVAKNPDFVREYDRIRGTALSRLGSRSGIEAAIDDATGRTEFEVKQFMADVADVIWHRLSPQTVADLETILTPCEG